MPITPIAIARSAGASARPPSQLRPRLVDPYRPFIDETLRRYPRLLATRLYDMVRERGYAGSIRTLREHAKVASDPSLKESLAMTAWGRKLLRRLDGDTAGPAVLALWRMFAWTTAGSPKHGFRISARAILDADEINAAAIAGNASP